jgi:large subunit ribosomal protein L25
MVELVSKIRKEIGKGLGELRRQKKLPAVAYGPEIGSIPLVLDYKDFLEVYREVRESSLFDLKIEDLEEKEKKFPVIIKEVQKDPLTGRIIHVDFYQVPLTEKIEVEVPLVFKGEAPAVKNLGGTLVKNLQAIEIKTLPNQIPKELEVDISKLATFEDEILVSDIKIPEGVEVLRSPEDVVAFVSSPEEIEEELEEPIEEKVEEVELVEEKGKKEEKEEASKKEET